MACPRSLHAATALLALSLAACAPRLAGPPGGSAGLAPLTPPPARPVVVTAAPAEQTALARGPALVLDDEALHGEQGLLEKLQDCLANLKQVRDANEEFSARARAAAQQAEAAQAELAETRRQLPGLKEQLKTATEALKKRETERDTAQAKVRELTLQVEPARKAAADAQDLALKLKEALAEIDKLRDQLLQAELARVKAEQDLVALQIQAARQQANVRRRPAPADPKAPTPPQPETTP
jgi:DNA repair exonuclease SbcCD ATPase subunit